MLIPLALRIITVKALRGQTYAQARVSDSTLDAVDLTVDGSPVIVVSSDDEEFSGESGKLLLAANRKVDIVIESAVAAKVVANDGTEQVTIPHTDAGMEAVLGFMGRQIMRAILTPATPWSDMWRRCVMSVPQLMIRRGGSAEQGVRFAARQMVIQCHTLNEPLFGDPIVAGSFWDDLLNLMAADADLANLAKIMRNEIATPTLAPYDEIAAALGISRASVAGIAVPGLMWNGSVPSGPLPPLADAQIDGLDITQQVIQDALTP